MDRKSKKHKSIFLIFGAVLAVVALLFACAGLIIDYEWQQKDQFAGDYSARVLQELEAQLAQSGNENAVPIEAPTEWDECEPHIETTREAEGQEAEEEADLYSVIPGKMPYMVVDDISYLGILTIPDIDLSLPVILLDEWDAGMMDYAPCTYAGSLKTHDLIIMAHNYEAHFRPILNMHAGQEVILQTADGYVYTYITTAVDTMHRSEREKLYMGEWDLTLFTCVPQTYNRCAVRCELVSVEGGK